MKEMMEKAANAVGSFFVSLGSVSVSYTHLTLPTIA